MHVHDILRPNFENELPNCFEKWQTFDVASGAADLCDDDIVFALVGELANAIFNYIRDVRNHLNGFAQIISAAFF